MYGAKPANITELGYCLAEALGSLQSLRLISVPSNNLTGAIPDSIGSLPYLDRLNIGNNNFTALPTFQGKTETFECAISKKD